MSEDRSDTLSGVLGRFLDHSLQRELEAQEIADLLDAINNHLLPRAEAEQNIFVLGSYDDDDEWKLHLVKTRFEELYRNKSESEASIYKMNDIPGGSDLWIDADLKFRLLAEMADCIVGVLENDGGGFTYEQGILSTEPDLLEKTHFFKFQYDTEQLEHKNYSWMQSEGILERLERNDQLHKWENILDLAQCCQAVYNEI